MRIYTLKFNRDIGASHINGVKNILANIFCYTVIADSERDAIRKFLILDKSGSPLSTDFHAYDFQKNFPHIYNNNDVQSLIFKMEESEIDDVDPKESNEQYDIYHNFIMENLQLIIDVLFLLNHTNCFSITEGYLISI